MHTRASDPVKSPTFKREPSIAADLAWGFSWLLWQLIRVPVFVCLSVLEPVAALVLGGFALLCVLTAFLLEFSGAAPNFPFWLVFGVGLGSAGILLVYQKLLHFFSR